MGIGTEVGAGAALRAAVLGLGLIGGSLLLRLAARAPGTVVGYDLDARTRQLAGDRLGPDAVAPTVGAAVAGADLVVLAVPLPALPDVLEQVAASGHTGLLTDVTSVKVPVHRLVRRHHPSARWVGGHPMAGREASGFAAADPALFDGCAWALCLDEDTVLTDWIALAEWVTGLGARVVPVTAADHDAAVARISHLPHLLAAALTPTAADGPAGALALGLGAGSFRDGTRVAATRAVLTAAMCGGNAAALGVELDALLVRLVEARRLLDQDDPTASLTEWLEPARGVRADWPPRPGPPEDLPLDDRDALLALGRAGGWLTTVTSTHATAIRPAQGAR